MNEMQTAWDAMRDGEIEQAQRLAVAIAKDDPENADAWYLLSELVSGERQDLFLRKAVSLDPTVVERYQSLSIEAEDESLTELIEGEHERTELPTEFFTYPDNRPEVDLPEKPELSTSAQAAPAEAASSAPAPEPRRPRRAATNILLLVIAILIIVVLYFFITSLL